MPIRDWPSSERPRERLLRHGAAVLSDAELLAIFLRTGRQGHTALDLARDLLGRFGGLRALLAATPRELCAISGLGQAKAAQLLAALELGRRHLGEGLKRGPVIESPSHSRDFLLSTLRDRRREVFCCLFLDNRHRVLAFEELFAGTLDGASVHPREVVLAALGHNAAAVVFAHNHPSGVAEPSRADEQITRRLREALALVDIRVLDHLVVGDGEVISLAERGLV